LQDDVGRKPERPGPVKRLGAVQGGNARRCAIVPKSVHSARAEWEGSMKKIMILGYGVFIYGFFFLTFLYLIGFVGNVFVPKSIDSGVQGPIAMAVITNILLMTLFGLQHSVMARPEFKDWWTRIVPQPIERSTFVLATNIVLITIFTQWQPITSVVWSVGGGGATILTAAFWIGWLVVLASTFVINHFDLFGLRQVYLEFKGRDYTHLPFATRYFYRFVRHPLYLGFLIAMWMTPVMTVGHLLFAAGMTSYILIAIRLEERDLVRFLGSDYQDYQGKVPMLIPRPGRTVPDSAGKTASAQ
jgi:protein-S-isoprenylcysteine O-methyltransferase Ste14